MFRWLKLYFFVDTDFLRAQSDPYRRMSANLYETKTKGEYYHIHGSLEASQTLNMIGLESFRPDLDEHDKIVSVIEPAVRKLTVDELEIMNAKYSQAGVPAYKYEDFLQTPHVLTCFPLVPITSIANHMLRVSPIRTTLRGESLLLRQSLLQHLSALPRHLLAL
jgi:hypothetical protein